MIFAAQRNVIPNKRYPICTLMKIALTLFALLLLINRNQAQTQDSIQIDTIKSNHFFIQRWFTKMRTSIRQDENEKLANYIYSLRNYVKFPNQNRTFSIGIYGKSTIDKYLEDVVNENAEKYERCILIHYKKLSDIQVIESDIIFICNSNANDIKHISQLFNSKPVLLVGENIKNFCINGGIINITPASSKRFEINKKAAEQKKLVISSHLLGLSNIIE